MNGKDTIFLSKLQLVIQTLDEIDDIAKETPIEQQNVDYEISDYQHLLQNEELNDDKIIELANKLKLARIKRNQLNNTSELIKTYYGNNKVLIYSNNRHLLVDAIKDRVSRFNKPYNYRVLNQETVDYFKHGVEKIDKDTKRRYRKYDISKDDFESKINSGMSNKDIALELGCPITYISVLKKKLGMDMRHYKKR